MELVIKTAAVCVPAALLAGLLRKDSPAMALLLALAAGCVVIKAASGAIGELAGFIGELADMSGVQAPIMAVLLKAVGIALVARLCADMCRDAGLTSAANASELAASAAALYTALPLMRGVLEAIRGLM